MQEQNRSFVLCFIYICVFVFIGYLLGTMVESSKYHSVLSNIKQRHDEIRNKMVRRIVDTDRASRVFYSIDKSELDSIYDATLQDYEAFIDSLEAISKLYE